MYLTTIDGESSISRSRETRRKFGSRTKSPRRFLRTPHLAVRSETADGGAFTDTVQSDIQTLQAAGKNVLISVGGEVNNDDPTWTGWTSAKYATCAANVRRLAAQIVYWVKNLGVYGVDIDFEDSGAFVEDGSGGFVAGYNGIQFLSDLTSELYQNLPPGSVITHAVNYNSAPYRQINEQAGQYIIWYNTQFYNNSAYDSNDALARCPGI